MLVMCHSYRGRDLSDVMWGRNEGYKGTDHVYVVDSDAEYKGIVAVSRAIQVVTTSQQQGSRLNTNSQTNTKMQSTNCHFMDHKTAHNMPKPPVRASYQECHVQIIVVP